ncbi:HesA/MoeB/ThiF family protein [Flavihumibacter profundi]|jgi:sulfur-carrier protein adenylyltransferase/sulfurtransferase|uniref:HesA/MoeB/ThiF family protein n=1 Tax=Flavihumibacter profundi TaxID=2716883 RepID=UPI001CC34914|nr:HesA/MoeB/ThiF family protein [Flavihumibacter profundi]MBZ5858324.1 HesA/MoeB/ThiF family protein [Flavihumibacter profundi]
MQPNGNKPDRYQRQLSLKYFGATAQEKLGKAKVLVIGAGGLGCPALLYLAAAGIGTIGLVDFDTVALSNLHRQVLYTMEDIGHPKAISAAMRLLQLNNEVTIQPYQLKLTNNTCLELFPGYDIIIDGTDNFSTRYMINDACVLLGKPLVYGAVSQYEGQVAIFNAGADAVNYRDLFPHPPKSGEVLNCAEAGVLGVLPGFIGTMQASETIKLITGIGETLENKLFTFNVLTNHAFELFISPNAAATGLLPQDRETFANTNYDWLCGVGSPEFEIEPGFFNHLLHQNNVTVIDVREPGEMPAISAFVHQKLPLSLLREKLTSIEAETVVFICQSGKRSLQAAKWLSEIRSPVKKIYSLQGGLLNWRSPSTD